MTQLEQSILLLDIIFTLLNVEDTFMSGLPNLCSFNVDFTELGRYPTTVMLF